MKANTLFLVLCTVLAQMSVGRGKEKRRDEKVFTMSKEFPYGYTIAKRDIKYLDITVRVPPIKEIRALTKNDTLVKGDVSICCYLHQYQASRGGSGSGSGSNGSVEEEGRWVPLVRVFCETPTDFELTGYYLIHTTDLPRWCEAKASGECKVRSGSIHLLQGATVEGEKALQPLDCDHRLTFTTSTESAVYVRGEVVEGGVLGSARDYLGAVILFTVFLVLSFEVADMLWVLCVGLIVTLCFLASAGRLPDGQEALKWMDADTLFYAVSVTMVDAVLDSFGFDKWAAYKMYSLTGCRVRRSLMLFWVASAGIGLIMPGISAQMLLTPVALALCRLARIEPAGVVAGQAFLVNAGGGVLLARERIVKSVTDAFNVSYGSFLAMALPGALLCQVALLAFLAATVARSFPAAPPKGLSVRRLSFFDREIVVDGGKNGDSGGDGKNTKDDSRTEDAAERRRRERHYSAVRYRLGHGHRSVRWQAGVTVGSFVAVTCLFLASAGADIDLGVSAIGCGVGLIALLDFRRVARCLRKFDFRYVLVSGSFSIFAAGISSLGLNRLLVRFVRESVQSASSPGMVGIILMGIFGIASCFMPNRTIATAMAPALKSIISEVSIDPALLGASIKVAVSTGACCTLLGSVGNLITAEICKSRKYNVGFITFTRYGLPATILVLGICLLFYHGFFF